MATPTFDYYAPHVARRESRTACDRAVWEVSGVLETERAAERAAVNLVEQYPVLEVELCGTRLTGHTERPDVVARYLAAFARARDIVIVQHPSEPAAVTRLYAAVPA
ncbi:hypothetical protein CLV28_1437 [Sediminihabitans luteus]|uniref:Uncharacterized protein n=1 Tax=Sediminihabitans luteus TaxID=1138585 RepID=A0A2M9CPX3_9CELL|nr:hypothetical protein [Sediminihabitans luteus]PJJ73953.1 hypothetical protein CLV28_1437 [Sediminihabitans luteus]GII98134.1 hypothetical protein Slu03_05120 [Sediminihabitans luteus]